MVCWYFDRAVGILKWWIWAIGILNMIIRSVGILKWWIWAVGILKWWIWGLVLWTFSVGILKRLNWYFERVCWYFERVRWYFEKVRWYFERVRWYFERLCWYFERVCWYFDSLVLWTLVFWTLVFRTPSVPWQFLPNSRLRSGPLQRGCQGIECEILFQDHLMFSSVFPFSQSSFCIRESLIIKSRVKLSEEFTLGLLRRERLLGLFVLVGFGRVSFSLLVL